MKCLSCGSDNPPNKRFCGMCGQSMIVNASDRVQGAYPSEVQYRSVQPAQPWPYITPGSTAFPLCRVFGGVGWLVVSMGTFLIAFGWLGTLDISYYDDPLDSLRMIGYGVIMLAISAILFSVREFAKDV